MASLWRLVLVSLVWTLSGVCAEDARIAPIPEAPAWQLASLMHLQLRAPESETLQLTYGVFPLTEQAGLNQSDRSVSITSPRALLRAEPHAQSCRY
jgi:hypothetical protein